MHFPTDQTKEDIYHGQYDYLSTEKKSQKKDFWRQELARLKALFPDALKGPYSDNGALVKEAQKMVQYSQ